MRLGFHARQPKLGKNFLMGHDLASRDRGASFRNVALFLFAHRLIINRGISQDERERIEHGLKQPHDR